MSLIPRKEIVVIRWTAGTEDSFTIKASVQATSAKTLQTLPEGDWASETYTLYTDTELLLKDRVILSGREFIVIKVAHWQHFKATSHYQAVVKKSIGNEPYRNI